MAERFGEASNSDLDEFMLRAENTNTKKQRDKWMKVYYDWAKLRNKPSEIQKLLPAVLDNILQTFLQK